MNVNSSLPDVEGCPEIIIKIKGEFSSFSPIISARRRRMSVTERRSNAVKRRWLLENGFLLNNAEQNAGNLLTGKKESWVFFFF